MQGEPNAAKITCSFDANIARIDLNPLGFEVLIKKQLAIWVTTFVRCQFDPLANRTAEIAQIRDNPLSRTALGSVGFDEFPVNVLLARFLT